MQKHCNKFFRGFLVVYLFFLVYHITGLHFGSSLTITGLAIGMILALFAHMRGGYGTIILLVIHMAIEWSEYAHHGTYSVKEYLFYGFHTMLDFVFLWQETKMHLARFRYLVMGAVATGLTTLFVYVSWTTPGTQSESTLVANLVEPLVLGGILGCTLSHLFERKRACRSKHSTA